MPETTKQQADRVRDIVPLQNRQQEQEYKEGVGWCPSKHDREDNIVLETSIKINGKEGAYAYRLDKAQDISKDRLKVVFEIQRRAIIRYLNRHHGMNLEEGT